MNGKILLDTNAIIYALNGALILPPAQYSISIITGMELFSYPKLSELEHTNIQRLLNHFQIHNITTEIKDKTIHIRKNYGIKLPDSIICATALVNHTTLISNDKQLSRVEGLKILSLEEYRT